MANHKNLPFSQLHVAKVRNGTLAGRPASQGVGDFYFCTDTFQVFFGTGAGLSAWEEFEGGGGQSYSGSRRERQTDIPCQPGDVGDYIDWNGENWDTDNLYGSGVTFNQPFVGIYQFEMSLQVENSEPTRWRVEIYYDQNTMISTHDFFTDGSGDLGHFNLTGQFNATLEKPNADANFYIFVLQNGVNPQNLLTYSYLLLQYMGVSA